MDLSGFKWIYIDLYSLSCIYMDVHVFNWIYMDLCGFTWIYMDLEGISVISGLVGRAACGALWPQAVAPIEDWLAGRKVAGWQDGGLLAAWMAE